MAALARARAAQVEETEDETRRRVEWIKHYVKTGQPEKALELGWDGKPIEAPAEPTVRQQKLQRAASSRMAGLRIVLEDCEDVGNRAAILRTAEAFGLLHIHEVPGAERLVVPGNALLPGRGNLGRDRHFTHQCFFFLLRLLPFFFFGSKFIKHVRQTFWKTCWSNCGEKKENLTEN